MAGHHRFVANAAVVFPNVPDFKAEVGFSVEFNVECEGRNFLH